MFSATDRSSWKVFDAGAGVGLRELRCGVGVKAFGFLGLQSSRALDLGL